MGHNYAKPATPEQRLNRVLSRVPADWAVSVERSAGTGRWRASVHPAGSEGLWAEDQPGLAEALEGAWRLNRVRPPEGA